MLHGDRILTRTAIVELGDRACWTDIGERMRSRRAGGEASLLPRGGMAVRTVA